MLCFLNKNKTSDGVKNHSKTICSEKTFITYSTFTIMTYNMQHRSVTIERKCRIPK